MVYSHFLSQTLSLVPCSCWTAAVLNEHPLKHKEMLWSQANLFGITRSLGSTLKGGKEKRGLGVWSSASTLRPNCLFIQIV